MKIFIELPTWLGDCVMTTPAIENIIKRYPQVRITLFGTFIATAIFQEHPNVEKIIIDESKQSWGRWFWLYRMARDLPRFDRAISFRSSLTSKILLFFLNASDKLLYRKDKTIEKHQVLRYNDFVNEIYGDKKIAEDLKIVLTPQHYKKPTLGLNPGASYGSAKRWYPEKFAEVAKALSSKYDIIIFGGVAEVDMANDIETNLQKENVACENIAGKTSIKELCQKIGGLDLFVTGDSGPMHVAAAYKVPTVAIFGPTKDKETSQWMNLQGVIVKREMECAPCMKRVCPLKHHECMKFIEASDVLEKVTTILHQ